MSSVVPPSLLFDFRLQIPRCEAPRGKKKVAAVPDHGRLLTPSSMNSEPHFAEVFAAWNTEGLALRLEVVGKSGPPTGTSLQSDVADGIRVWLDVRPSGQVHRATEYCHCFCFLPADENSNNKPAAVSRPIPQQKIQRQEPNLKLFGLAAKTSAVGYQLDVWMPGSQLYGFREVEEIGRIGFSYEVNDSELGLQPFHLGDDFPTSFDPSTWVVLELGD